MKSLTYLLMGLLPAISYCSALAADASSPVPDTIVLRPIVVRDYEASPRLHRRKSEKFTGLDPSTQAQLIYGSPGNDGQKLLADMTLYAPDGLQIVSMEKFEPLTSKVDCNADDGILSLTFKSQQAYDYALRKWSFVNENKDDRFLLIANHAGCGPDDERQPYLVSSVDNDDTQNVVFLHANEASWSDVAGTYDLAFGHAAPKLKPRFISWDDVKGGLEDTYQAGKKVVQEVGEGIDDGIHGNANLAKSLTFSVAAGKSGKKTLLYKDQGGQLQLDCVDCYVAGKFQVTGRVHVKGWHLKDLTIEASPQDFKAMMKLEATITAEKKPKTLGNQKELFAAPIPGAGFTIPRIAKLGTTMSYTVGYNTTFQGKGVVDFGLQVAFPNSAKTTVNLAGPGSSSATGFDGSLKPVFEVKSLSASVALAAFSKPQVNFGVELEKVGKVSVALAFKAPEVSSTLTAKYAPKGVCKDDPKKTKTGIDMENKVKLAASVEVNAELGSDADNALPKWSKDLWSKPFALPGKCFPIATRN